MKNIFKKQRAAFTLVELLISIAILMTVSTIVAGLYVDGFRETQSANTQNQIYEDGRFILQKIAQEIRENTVDYDEYYNQNVVIPTLIAGQPAIPGIAAEDLWRRNYGQNYGRYYSSFFNPGKDNALGFDCNDAPLAVPIGQQQRDSRRNARNCIPLRKTMDRNTGQNPFAGKYSGAAADKENAFCGNISYQTTLMLQWRPDAQKGSCGDNGDPNPLAQRSQGELYLISADGKTKTILARERVGGTDQSSKYALSLLRMKGIDIDEDKIPDRFVCADEFQCVGGDDIPDVSGQIAPGRKCIGDESDLPGELPRSRELELQAYDVHDACDSPSGAFSKDFVPISPLTVNVKDLRFIVLPSEDPRYAFAEFAEQKQPLVTIVMTVEPNYERLGLAGGFEPFTMIETVSSLVK